MRHIIVFLLLVPFSAIANDAQPCHDHLKFGLKKISNIKYTRNSVGVAMQLQLLSIIPYKIVWRSYYEKYRYLL